MGFLTDLINNPNAAIEKISEKRKKWKAALLFIGLGMLLLTNFFITHFLGGYPTILIFILLIALLGILLEFAFVMGFVSELYLFLKLTKYKPAGDTSKLVMWCVIIPSFIYYLGLFLINLILINAGVIEAVGWLYDTFKYLLYIWILGLAIVVVLRNHTEHKFRNILGVIGTFTLNWVIWVSLNMLFFQDLFTTFISGNLG
jgi:hypothetical protein